MQNLIFISIFTNLYMIGVSLITHFVTYPSFELVPEKKFQQFHNAYTKKMLFIVGPVMIIEFISVFIMVIHNIELNSILPFLLVFIIWIFTFFLIVPLHNQLAKNYNKNINEKLIKFNAFRTSFWVLKFIFLATII